jgi:hypothetical protein
MHAILEWLRHALAYEVLGLMTVKAILVTLVVLPVLNELIARRRSVTAQSIIQAIGNAGRGSPLFSLPIFKQIFTLMGTPGTLPPPDPMDGGLRAPKRNDGGPLALLPFFFALHLVGRAIVLLSLAALFMVWTPSCAGADWKLNNPTTLPECMGAAPGVALGIQQGIESRGGFASILGLIAAAAPCAQAIAMDLMSKPNVPAEVKGRAEMTLSLSHSIMMRRLAGKLSDPPPPDGIRMENKDGEMMIRGFGR